MAKVIDRQLINAVRMGDVARARELLAAGADKDKASSLGWVPHWTPLHWACSRGDQAMVQLLLDVGADKDVSGSGVTPLYMACSNAEAAPVVRMLLDVGVQVNKGAKGNAPLLRACHSGCVESVKMLLGAGADCGRVREDGYTALHVACSQAQLEVAEVLLDAGADVDQVKTDTGDSPLVTACKAGSTKVVKALLARGAKVEQAGANARAHDSKGGTPMDVAQRCPTGESVVRMLLDFRQVQLLWLIRFRGRCGTQATSNVSSGDTVDSSTDGRVQFGVVARLPLPALNTVATMLAVAAPKT